LVGYGRYAMTQFLYSSVEEWQPKY
jgi:hypothetical protein